MMNTAYQEYLIAEEQHFGENIQVLGELLEIFPKCDELFRFPLSNSVPVRDNNGMLVCQLFTFILERQYVSITCFLRCKFSDALAAARQAIDAGFSALLVTEGDEGIWKRYADHANDFVFVKHKMKERIKAAVDPQPGSLDYVLKHLVYLHEQFSQWGSHADSFTVFNKRTLKVPVVEDESFKIHYCLFQDQSQDDYKFYFLHIVGCYVHLLRLFEVFWQNKLEASYAKWKNDLETLCKEMDVLNHMLNPNRSIFSNV
jgi:hypothetical protein